MTTAELFFHSQTIDHLLSRWGYVAVFGMVSVESLGIPVPGETTLIAAALYAGATGRLDIWLVLAVAVAGAVAGDNVGYAIGRFGGFTFLRRHGKRLHIDERRLKLGHYIFSRHGGKVVFFGRFVSILRTYAAFFAGVNRMRWRSFLVFNAAGGAVWAAIYTLGYYYFGRALKQLRTPVDIAIGAAATLIVVAFVIYLRRKERELSDRAERELPDDVLDNLDDGKAHSEAA